MNHLCFGSGGDDGGGRRMRVRAARRQTTVQCGARLGSVDNKLLFLNYLVFIRKLSNTQ